MANDRLPEALEQYVNTEDWDQARRVVERNGDLLRDEAVALLAESVADYRRVDRDEVADYLEQHRIVLERSREVGIDQAFQEANARARDALETRQRQLAALRPPEPDPAQAVVWQLLDAESPEEVERVLSAHPELSRDRAYLDHLDDLMSRARDAGHTAALHILREYRDLLRAFYELPPLMQALQELITVPTWAEARDVLRKRPELLSDQAIQTLNSLIREADAQDDEATALALVPYRSLIERSRQVGPERAVEEIAQREEASAAP